MSLEKPLVMLVNVGGSHLPVIHSLNQQQPAYICFFVSKDSKPLIWEKILPALNYNPRHYDWIETPAPQDLLACYKALEAELPQKLTKWEVPPEALCVEYTAGTKPMSVASVLVTINTTSQYSYVGAADASGRDHGGIGFVLEGREYIWNQVNPWEQLAVPARREIAMLFNLGRLTDAHERTLRLSKVAPAEMRKFYEALAELFEGYALWDRFDYRQAQAKIYKSLAALRLYTAGREDPLRLTLDTVEQQAEFLRRLNEKNEESQRLDTLDMLANAARRADASRRYDDAVARLYATLESIARKRLSSHFKIQTNAASPDLIPVALRDEYIRLYGETENCKFGLRLGLDASYRLLAALDDPLGQKYIERKAELDQVLYARNQSRLAHGVEPVKPETYQKLSAIVMDFANASEAELPRFPEIRL